MKKKTEVEWIRLICRFSCDIFFLRLDFVIFFQRKSNEEKTATFDTNVNVYWINKRKLLEKYEEIKNGARKKTQEWNLIK